jgi:hypothetical protein
MKQILGDNQFFGVNHNDLAKGETTKMQFKSDESIISFINQATSLGLDGFMMNSNTRGYEIIQSISKCYSAEIHYSVPYPHRYATIVNESGMLKLLNYIIKKSSFKSLFFHFPRFLIFRDVRFLLPLILELEIPKSLKKGNYVYLQNIVTDLLLGVNRHDLLNSFCSSIVKLGYYPGLITLNPVKLDKVVSRFDIELQKKMIICFNININGFNVFPDLESVEALVKKKSLYKKMGMSIFSSGGAKSINNSIEYIKRLKLDYIVYGSSNIENIIENYSLLKKN